MRPTKRMSWGVFMKIQEASLKNLAEVCKTKLNIVFQGYQKEIFSLGHCDAIQNISETTRDILKLWSINTTITGFKN